MCIYVYWKPWIHSDISNSKPTTEGSSIFLLSIFVTLFSDSEKFCSTTLNILIGTLPVIIAHHNHPLLTKTPFSPSQALTPPARLASPMNAPLIPLDSNTQCQGATSPYLSWALTPHVELPWPCHMTVCPTLLRLWAPWQAPPHLMHTPTSPCLGSDAPAGLPPCMHIHLLLIRLSYPTLGHWHLLPPKRSLTCSIPPNGFWAELF